jgi:hypothetical protein
MAMSLLRKHHIFMHALAGRRCLQRDCSDARCFAAAPYAFGGTGKRVFAMGKIKGKSESVAELTEEDKLHITEIFVEDIISFTSPKFLLKISYRS